ncbi:unnamed protein product [Microthlaspi erraticum]|uniref:Uncharacterized protein n=1 Tax=Microthlaspi erraticum TaxID=1685480 RepID=A0A6D2HQZ7_9BRAS|nr:unnamed protein product [Microthlaspi erraticum]
MSNRIPQSHGHGQVKLGPSGPGLLAFFGCFGFLAWRLVELRVMDKRSEEYGRRKQLIRERHAIVSVMNSIYSHGVGLGFGVGLARVCAGPKNTRGWVIKEDWEKQERELEETEALLKELRKSSS